MKELYKKMCHHPKSLKLYALRFLPAHLKPTLPVLLHFNTFISNTLSAFLKIYIYLSLYLSKLSVPYFYS